MEKKIYTVDTKLFRKKITDENFGKRLLKDDNIKDIEYELKKIERTVTVLLKNIERRKDD